jgi:4'-phosphopantetheinyl transferase
MKPPDRVDVLLVRAGDAGCVPPKLLSTLTPEEVARADRFLQPRDRWLFVLGRVLLRHALRERFGIANAPLGLTANGRPELSPAHGDIDFNLSHTPGHVACALGHGCAVGIDVEREDRAVEIEDITRAYFAPSEREIINQVGPRQKHAVFMRLWTLKEAVAKAAGQGLSLDFDRFAIALDPARLETTAGELGERNLWQLSEWLLPDAVRLALAIRRPDPRPVPVGLVNVQLADLLAAIPQRREQVC